MNGGRNERRSRRLHLEEGRIRRADRAARGPKRGPLLRRRSRRDKLGARRRPQRLDRPAAPRGRRGLRRGGARAMTIKYPDIAVTLVGRDGNAFAVLGSVQGALRRAGVPQEEIDEFYAEAMSGDYDHLLRTCMESGWTSTDLKLGAILRGAAGRAIKEGRKKPMKTFPAIILGVLIAILIASALFDW